MRNFFFIQSDYDYDDDEGDEFDEWGDHDPSSQNEDLSVTNYSEDNLSITSSDVTRVGQPATVIYSFEVCD